jgi:hypothetical protein
MRSFPRHITCSTRGIYKDNHETIRFFWEAMSSFTPDQRRNFIRCGTSPFDANVVTRVLVLGLQICLGKIQITARRVA